MTRTVLLRHELPDGSWHYDWLLEPEVGGGENPDERVLIAWRVTERPDQAVGQDLAAVRLPAHRRLYLTHEGEVSGGRGRVRRVLTGECDILRDTASGFEALVRWRDGPSLWVRGQPASRESWVLHVVEHGVP